MNRPLENRISDPEIKHFTYLCGPVARPGGPFVRAGGSFAKRNAKAVPKETQKQS
jgi:hypothetical protein